MSRHRTTSLLTAAAALLALGLTGCGSDDSGSDAPAPGASSASDTATSGAAGDQSTSTQTTALTADGSSAAGKCMVPNAEALATQTTAFEGTVLSVQDGTATLQVDRWFAGGESEQVTVAAPDEELRALLSAVDFQVGKTYLVSATGNRVSLCGFTAEKSPELEALYSQAFAS
jgi:ABC-type phosphate transport system substrate-binding protein